MDSKRLRIQYMLILGTLAAFFSWAAIAGAQSVPQGPEGTNDITRSELASFDQFLDSHPEAAEQLRQDPTLVNNQEFVERHPELQEYLQQHPGVREELKENPNQFVRDEKRFDRREDNRGDNDVTRRELASFDSFLDSHPEIAEQLRKDPSLVNDRSFVKNHPDLAQYLDSHPAVKEEYRENPNAFFRGERRFERHEDFNRRGDNDVTRRELASFDGFLDSHPEIAEQLRKDPSLVNDRKFVTSHQALAEYLDSHPGVKEEYRENPTGFLRDEQRFERHDDFNRRGDNDVTRGELANFDRFLDGHPEISEQLKKDPSLVNDKTFVKNHAALADYLDHNPGVKEEYRENPNAFMHQEQRFDRREDGFASTGMSSELNGFGQFLGGHSGIAQQLSKDPSLAQNDEYVQNHPELQAYLKAHPNLQQQLKQDPNVVMQSVQQQNQTSVNAKTTPAKTVHPDPKPKQ